MNIQNKMYLEQSLTSLRNIVALVSAGLTGTFVYYYLKRILKLNGDKFKLSSKELFHLEIPRETVAYLIGKGGNNIQDIEQQTGVSISFVNPGGPFKLCVLEGTCDQEVHKAKKLILKSVEEFNQLETAEVSVSQEVMDYLIANDNLKLNEIMATCNARTHIYRVEDKHEKFLVRGLHHQIEAVKHLLKEISVFKDEINKNKEISTIFPKETKKRKQKPLGTVPILKCSDQYPSRSESRTDTLLQRKGAYEQLEATSSDNYCEIMVSAIINPFKFFVQKAGPLSSELDRLIDDMTVYFSDETNRRPFSGGSDAEIGKLVSVYTLNDKQWYRAKITAKPTVAETIAVQLLDFGDVIIVPLSDVEQLPSKFLKLKFQAIECRLAFFKPFGGGWTDNIGKVFDSLTYCTQWKIIMARIQSYSQLENGALVPCVKLIDTNTEKDIDIAAELIRRGLGDYFPN